MPVIRLCGACAVGPRQPGTRAASGPALGVLRPLREELADARPVHRDMQARTGAAPPPHGSGKSRSRASRGAPARVMGRSSPANRRWTAREAGHGVRRSAPAPVGALLPYFFGSAKSTRAPGALLQTGRRSVGCAMVAMYVFTPERTHHDPRNHHRRNQRQGRHHPPQPAGRAQRAQRQRSTRR